MARKGLYMKKIFLTLTLSILIFSCLWAENSFTIAQMTENNIQLKLHIDEYSFSDISIKGKLYQNIELSGINFLKLSEEGAPQLPFFSKVIGLPPDGNISAKIISENHKIIENKNISYNPTYFEKNDELIANFDIPASYQNRAFLPDKLIESELAGYVGNRYLGVVRIFPIQFNPKENKVKIYTDLTISIRITGKNKKNNPPAGGGSNYIDNIADDFILNNKLSKNWRKEKEPSYYPKHKQDESVINKFQFIIDQKGIYKTTYSFLKDTVAFWQDSLQFNYQFDFDIDEINPKYLELSNKGNPVPIYFSGEYDGSFDEEDYFEFYADINHGKDCFYDNYSWENYFTLEYNEGHLGARLAVEDCGLYETDPRKYKRPYLFDTTLHLEKQSLYAKLSQVSNIREDLWFWTQISAPNMKSFPFILHNPVQTNARSATINVSLFGNTYYKTDPETHEVTNSGMHHALAYINASQVGNVIWGGQFAENSGQTEAIITGTISNDNLNDGTNMIYISMPGDTDASYDMVMLNYIDITYWREYTPYDGILEFNKPSFLDPQLLQFEINGFQSSDIDVYKIGVSKLENVSIESTMPAGGSPFIVTFQDEVIDDSTKYIAVSSEKKLVPKFVKPDIPSNLHDTNNQADYILISIRDFINDESIPEFISHWQNYGNLTVKPVALEDIFDEFSYGIRSAQAIQDFLKYAYNNWQEPVVQYVLLLGDACYDERDSSPDKKYSIVPTSMSWSYDIGATVDDNWFACIVGDDELPDLSIGRIPIWEKEQIAPVLEKTIHYNTKPNFNDVWRNHCMLIAGGAGTFEEQNERLKAKYIPDTYRVSRIYAQRPHDDPYWGGTTDLKDYIDDGTAFIQFMGHGGGQIWSDLNLLNLADISTLFNDNYPIISSLTCYTSNFEYAKCSSLGEAFIIEPEKGAIGFFGGAGKGFLTQDEVLAEFMLNNIFNRDMRNFAELSNLSKIEYCIYHGFGFTGLTFLRSFNYLGDPAINIVLPKKSLNVELDSHEFIIGDTVQIFINNIDSTLNRVAYYITDEQDLIPDPYHEDEKKQVELYDINRKFYNDSGYEYIIDTTHTEPEFTQIVRSYAYDDTSDYIGYTKFTVGKSAIFDIKTIPSVPCLGDSVTISAKVFDKDGIDSVRCIWWTNQLIPNEIPMIANGIKYTTINNIPPFYTKNTVCYQIEYVDSLGNYNINNIEEDFNNWDDNSPTGIDTYNGNGGIWTTYNGMCSNDNAYEGNTVKLSNEIGSYLLSPSNQNIGAISFYYKLYRPSTDTSRCARYSIQYKVGAGEWNTIGNFSGSEVNEYKRYYYSINKKGDIQIQIIETDTTEEATNEEFYLDNFWISDSYYTYELTAPDINLLSFDYTIYDKSTYFEVVLRNDGKLASPPTVENPATYPLKIFNNGFPITSITICESLLPMQSKKYLLPFSLPSGEYYLTASVNPDHTFPELDYSNNIYPKTSPKMFYLNSFLVNPNVESSHASLDSNLVVTFPAGIVDEDSYFYINKVEINSIDSQPDISQILLKNVGKVSYEIGIFDSTELTESGTFQNNKNITLTFNYSETDSLTQSLEKKRNFKMYRYKPEFMHWFLLGGDIYPENDSVTYTFVEKPGIYSLFQNNDFTPPIINVNVEGQEFTNGEYVDDNAIFSFLLQDDNGINVEKIKLFLNGETVTNYSISKQNLNLVPVKYQIDVDKGSYTIIISVSDANGNYQECVVNFSVQKEFNIIHIGNYPNPVRSVTSDPNNEGRTRFTYTLIDDADDIKIKIFTVSGRVVNTLSDLPTTVGYHEYPRAMKGWDCIDYDGRKLANGVYFWKIIAKKGGKVIEKIEKLAILR